MIKVALAYALSSITHPVSTHKPANIKQPELYPLQSCYIVQDNQLRVPGVRFV
ncbi:hypothetical protein K443DRAFT_679167 [Laccaria amethystina LaAM-08-1]|uniref:Unplaced genomic scaffold K443scaffold_90, whole genome shotgun sequence n=1 Tax=Laccaria amethystina LaAM-08-1 TaxID=1095629 RepID=A0A0C9XFR3_9AGAR|nr:hypothetical protein K443DRAFT_679167 [Laccaria amethystina LaAM-08-1]